MHYIEEGIIWFGWFGLVWFWFGLWPTLRTVSFLFTLIDLCIYIYIYIYIYRFLFVVWFPKTTHDSTTPALQGLHRFTSFDYFINPCHLNENKNEIHCTKSTLNNTPPQTPVHHTTHPRNKKWYTRIKKCMHTHPHAHT